VASGKGYALVRTGRRGGLPVLWSASDEMAASGAGPQPAGTSSEKYVRAEFAFAGSGPDVVRLTAEIDPSVLLTQALAGSDSQHACGLRDANRRVLADSSAPRGDPPALSADATIRAEGWSSPSPWVLECASDASPDASLAPVAQRYRLTLGLNLGAMALAALLGSFAIQQTRRRERLEGRARDEMKIRELERQLFHAERLGTVGRLAAGMAHEINNPLEGMSNYLSLAKDELARGQVEKVASRLQGVGEGMERIAGIVRQVLANADPAHAQPAPVDVCALVRQTVDFIRTRRELGGISFAVDADGERIVAGNPVTLGQVLLNIVLNACEAQPNGGEVRVEVRTEPGHVVVEIADRGPGIAADDLARVFDPFFSTKESTGLGLSICHAIVRQHDGELVAGNREGGGALFRIRLPSQ
jgi:signal transduction histidine kinase